MRWFKILALSVAALAIVNACADSAARDLGKMMVDAGQALGGRAAPARKPDSGQATEPGRPYGRDAGVLMDAGRMMIDAGHALIDAADHQLPDAAADTPSVASSGSRIRIRRLVHTGDDGTRLADPPSYYDQQLKSDCTLGLAADGVQRCLPIVSRGVLAPNMTGAASVYGDAQCSTIKLVGTADCESFAYVSAYAGVWTICQTRTTGYRVYRVEEYAGPVYSSATGTCMSLTEPLGERFYVVGAEVAPAEMVAFTTTAEDVP